MLYSWHGRINLSSTMITDKNGIDSVTDSNYGILHCLNPFNNQRQIGYATEQLINISTIFILLNQ